MISALFCISIFLYFFNPIDIDGLVVTSIHVTFAADLYKIYDNSFINVGFMAEFNELCRHKLRRILKRKQAW